MASLLGLDAEDKMDEADIKKLLDSVADPAGTYYRFSLPASILRRKKME